MTDELKNNIQEIREIVKSNKIIKTVLIIGVGVGAFYLLSKTFKGLATTVRAFNELKSAINGN